MLLCSFRFLTCFRWGLVVCLFMENLAVLLHLPGLYCREKLRFCFSEQSCKLLWICSPTSIYCLNLRVFTLYLSKVTVCLFVCLLAKNWGRSWCIYNSGSGYESRKIQCGSVLRVLFAQFLKTFRWLAQHEAFFF